MEVTVRTAAIHVSMNKTTADVACSSERSSSQKEWGGIQLVELGEPAQRMDGMNPLQERSRDVLTEEDRYLEDSIEDIILNLEDETICRAIRDLTDDQKRLLYEIAILMERPSEIAAKAGTSCAAVMMARIKAKLLRK